MNMAPPDTGEHIAPTPVLFDFELPDALRRARYAALQPLVPTLRARGWTEPKLMLLRALARAGEPLTQGEAAARAGLNFRSVRVHIDALVAEGYLVWVPPAQRGFYPKIAARDIARRHTNLIARDALLKHGGRDWAQLAALPAEARITEPMRRRLFALTGKLRRAAAGEPVLEGTNAPDGDGGDDPAFALTLETRRTRMALVARVARALRPYGFSEAQWRILRILAWQPGLGWTVEGLGRRGCFHFANSAVTRTLFILHERDLIRRSAVLRPKPYRTDWHGPQRLFRAEIERAGLDMVSRVEAREAKDCADLFERLRGDEMAELDALLGRVTLALLWRDGLAPEDQDVHPLVREYERFDAYVADAARALEFHNRILRENGLPIRTRTVTHWWE